MDGQFHLADICTHMLKFVRNSLKLHNNSFNHSLMELEVQKGLNFSVKLLASLNKVKHV